MFDNTYTTKCQLCQRFYWPLYPVRLIRDEYKPHYRRPAVIVAGELMSVCHPCLHSRNDLVEYYEHEPLCQEMAILEKAEKAEACALDT